MKKDEYLNYWRETAAKDINSMQTNFDAGKYDWALFIGHLSLEKILKALWVKNNEGDIPPRTHNLIRLAEEAHMQLTAEETDFLLDVNTFNLETRYPDYKLDFYKKCTREFTSSYLVKIKEFYECIHKQI